MNSVIEQLQELKIIELTEEERVYSREMLLDFIKNGELVIA